MIGAEAAEAHGILHAAITEAVEELAGRWVTAAELAASRTDGRKRKGKK
jgi:hypothetical protein